MIDKIEKNKGHMFLSAIKKNIDFTSENSGLISIKYRTDQTVQLKTKSGENLIFSKVGKIAYENKTSGEEVIELSGAVVDQKKDKSWAIACFKPGGFSPKHHHKERTEIYYVTAGIAKLVVDDETYELNAGASHVIRPGQKHQVTNLDENRILEIMVECTPSWEFHDHKIDSENKVEFEMKSYTFQGF